MNESDALRWLEDLSSRARRIPDALPQISGGSLYLAATPAMAWLAEAHSALQSIFPPGHALLNNWTAIFERAKVYSIKGAGPGSDLQIDEPNARVHFNQAAGLIDAAVSLLQAGRLRALTDGIRAETVSEVLDQADVLITAQHRVAAAVLAGGGLETHLLHLCQRNQLTWTGDGSIAKYDQAIAKARNDGVVEVYSSTDTKLIVAWGGIRNDAAHDPTTFNRSLDEVRTMILGIRQFISRVR